MLSMFSFWVEGNRLFIAHQMLQPIYNLYHFIILILSTYNLRQCFIPERILSIIGDQLKGFSLFFVHVPNSRLHAAIGLTPTII